VISSVAKSLLISLGIGYVAHVLLQAIGSSYVAEFLKANIVNIQIGLLAINAATLGIVLTKLRDLVDKGVDPHVFAAARAQMLLSIKEQVGLIIAALVILSVSQATSIPFRFPSGLLDVLLVTCFAYSLLILYDTAKSVFVVLES